MGVLRRLVSLPERRDSFRLPPSSRPETSKLLKHTMAKGSGSKRAKKSGSNVFALFSQRQIQEFKEAFGIMDADKDGLLSSSDIVAAFNSVGKSVSDGEAQGMLSEAPGPVNFTQMFIHSLITFGDKFTNSEVDNAYSEFLIEDGFIDATHLKGLMVSKKEEGEE